MIHSFLAILLNYLKEIVEIGLLGFFVAGLVNAYVRPTAIVRHLGRGGIAGNGLASIVGLVTPLCCCSAIPTALSLYRNGAGRGPACAFLIATPWFNFYGLAALTVFLGVRGAMIVGPSSVVIAFLTGLLIDVLDKTPVARVGRTLPSLDDGGGDSDCCDGCTGMQESEWGLLDFRDHPAKLRAALAFVLDLAREVGPWILAGVVLGTLVEVVVPERLFTTYLGGGHLLGLLAALFLAAIFYTDSLGALPWVQSLVGKGIGAGSAMALLVAGVGTNLSTLGPISRVMGMRTAVIYAAGVVVFTGLLGYTINLGR